MVDLVAVEAPYKDFQAAVVPLVVVATHNKDFQAVMVDFPVLVRSLAQEQTFNKEEVEDSPNNSCLSLHIKKVCTYHSMCRYYLILQCRIKLTSINVYLYKHL